MAAKRSRTARRNGKRRRQQRNIAALIVALLLLISGGVYLAQTGILASVLPQSASKQTPVQRPKPRTTASIAENSANTTASSQAQTDANQVAEIVWEKQEAPVRLPILMYHAIHVMAPEEEANANLIVDPTTFENHLKALQEAGYYAVSPEEAYKILTENVLPQGKKVVWLTFDDSLWDFYDIAYPLLKQYKMQATNNVITGTVGNEGNLTLDEMKEMKENGISLQGHTVNHPSLEVTDPAVQTTELTESKAYLDSNLGQDTISLAYPSGSYSADTLTLAEQANYKLGTTTNEGIASAADGLLSLNRVRILPTTTPELLLQSIATE